MRLTVNGVPVRVTDRIEIEIDVPKDGDTLLNGMSISIRGGPLTIEQGDSLKHCAFWMSSDCQRVGDVCFFHDSQLSFIGGSDQSQTQLLIAGHPIEPSTPATQR